MRETNFKIYIFGSVMSIHLCQKISSITPDSGATQVSEVVLLFLDALASLRSILFTE